MTIEYLFLGLEMTETHAQGAEVCFDPWSRNRITNVWPRLRPIAIYNVNCTGCVFLAIFWIISENILERVFNPYQGCRAIFGRKYCIGFVWKKG